MYDPRNPNQPPYTQEYIKRFREAQFARNRRITKWAKEKLAHLKAKNDGEMEHCCITPCLFFLPIVVLIYYYPFS